MKKKVVSAAMAVVLALSVSVGAFAASSKSNISEVSSVKAADGTTIQNTQIVRSANAATEVTADQAKAAISGSAASDTVSVLDQFDLSASKDITTSQFPLTITFNVPGITKDMNVKVLHFENNAWKDVTVSVGDGSVTAKFSSLSPVAIVKLAPASTTTGGSGATSPKTGETGRTALAVGALLAASVGIALIAKKKNA